VGYIPPVIEMSKAKLKTKRFDPAAYLDNDEAIAVYMSDALESGDPSFVADALGVVVRARGVSGVIRCAGVGHPRA